MSVVLPGRQRLRRIDPGVVDVLLALLITAVAQLDVAIGYQQASARWDPVTAALAALQTVPLIWRRRAPGGVLVVVGIAALAYQLRPAPGSSFALGMLVATYSAAAHARRVQAMAALPLAAAVVAARVARSRPVLTLPEILLDAVVFATAWILGDNVRTHRAYEVELERRADRLERDRTAEAARAAARERTRIARELHDVVAHHVSVIAVQAGAAAEVAAAQPARAVQALDTVSATAREALAELRRLLGVLRRDEPDPPLGPSPRVDELEPLLEQTRQAGLPVTLTVEGPVRPLPPALALSAYRIVQEALTNTLRHAGPARARVCVRYGEDELVVIVEDDGSGAGGTAGGAGAAPGAGHGLVGMRERVALFGGDLDAGPRLGGGYAVRARLRWGAERT